MSLVVPYLGRYNWKGKDLLLHRDLLKTNHLQKAVVCYGMKDGSGINQYLTSIEAEQCGYDLDRVENEAMDNLVYLDQEEDAEWVPVITESQGQDVTVLTKVGGDFTASNILRADILRDLQHYFETPTVAIGIPNRNTMLACAEPLMLLDCLKLKFEDSVSRGYEPVSDMIYLARGGQLIGAAPFPGTEEQVDENADDLRGVSFNKASGSGLGLKKEFAAIGRPKTIIKYG